MATTTNYGWTTPNDTDLVKDGAAAIRTLGSSIDTTTKNLNPETTLGDLAYRSATANVKTRLGLGTAGQVLRVNSGATAPEWATTADQTPLTTKGDLFGFDTADARIPIGTNGHILTADSTQSLGLKWAAPAASGSGMTLISRTEFSNVASQAFDGVFTSTYTNYLAIIDYIEAGTFDDTLHLQFRYAGPTTQAASYYGSSLEQPRTGSQVLTSTDNANQFTITADIGGSSGGQYGSGQIFFENVGNVSTNGSYNGKYLNAYTAGQYIIGGQVNVNRIYTGFLLKAAGSNITGAVSIYGLAKS
jgi:hypothetical protein